MSDEEQINYIHFLAEFVENYSETHTEEVAELGEFAEQLSEAKKAVGEPDIDKGISESKSYRNYYPIAIYLNHGKRMTEESFIAYKRGEERFIKSALSALERIEEVRGDRSEEALTLWLTLLSGRTSPNEEVHKALLSSLYSR